MSEVEIYNVSVKLTKKEAEEFDNAIKKHGKFLNRSDAIRGLIREFIEDVNKTGDSTDIEEFKRASELLGKSGEVGR